MFGAGFLNERDVDDSDALQGLAESTEAESQDDPARVDEAETASGASDGAYVERDEESLALEAERADAAVSARATERQLNTRQWRLDWWNTIVDYTVRGEYFWTGKGFGENLAVSDGFETGHDPPVRSPHNIHMTFLARMGVPGLVAWVLLQAVFAVSVFRVYMRQSESESEKWIRPMAGFVLVFWLAVMVNSTFDVYLEGPQGGIWFWSVFGLGLALIGFDRANRGARLRETGHDGLPG
jgi:hypothetical protein